MRIQNFKIGTQLRTGLGLIILLVFVLGAFAWYQANRIWEQTDMIYSHPMKVRKAIAELKTDVLLWDRYVKNIVHDKNNTTRQDDINAMNLCEADATRQLDSISVVYLGPQKDVSDIYNAWVKLKETREMILEMIREGKNAEAISSTLRKGYEEAQIDQVLKEINDVSLFSFAKADQLYKTAKINKETLQLFMLILSCAILLFSFLISLILVRGIKKPIEEMMIANDEFRNGNLNARIGYSAKNEFGNLASSINRLAEANKFEILNRDVLVQVADVIIKKDELHPFCHELLRVLMEKSGSQTGAVYLLNEPQTHFDLFQSIGFSSSARAQFSATSFEGEFGLAMASRQIRFIKDIPEDTSMVFSAAAGDFRPREIVIIPILSGKDVVAIISMASLSCYSSEAIRLINDIYITLIARFNGILSHQKILDFSKKLEAQNRELEERARELDIQGNELSQQNLELEMQKQQLDEANRLKSSFLSNMSHELRTPLNSVIALSGVLSRRLHDKIPEDEYSYLGIIERNGKNLLTLINDILDLSRIEAGHEEINFSNFSMYDLVEEVVTMLETQAKDKNIGLINKVPRGLQPLQSDYGKCRHILQNIIGNAVKFTEKGEVEVTAIQLENEIGIAVSDTGIGISDHDLPNIFDEFRQADEGSSRKYGGTGLGLAIAKKFTGLLNGKIRVVSQPGKGSTFTLILPTMPEISERIEGETGSAFTHYVKKPPSSPPSSFGAGKKILLVEDSEPAIIQIKDILCEQGFTVFAARNGKEAMEQLSLVIPDAMILDLMMPEVDGFQVLKMIRETKATSKLPVLILTAKHITKEELSFLKRNNVHQFMRKGDVSKPELLAMVGEMVNTPLRKAAKIKAGPRSVKRTGNPLILIVEDNPDDVKTLKALLLPDYTIVVASDGEEGVSQAMNCKPDLILMDISLPVMDGMSAFEEIRKTEVLQDIPVIAITARAMKGSREEILECGFDDYISKPIDIPLFRRVLDHYLKGETEPGNNASNIISIG